MKKQRLIWVAIHEKEGGVTPTYYFDFDLLNQLGFPDSYIFDVIKEMNIMAEKEVSERSNKPQNLDKQ